MPVFVVSDWLNAWITPLWMIGLGCCLGLLALLVLWGLATVCRLRFAAEIPEMLGHGVLAHFSWVTLGLALIGITGFVVVRDRDSILASLARVPFTGTYDLMRQVPPLDEQDPDTVVAFPAAFLGGELRKIEVESPNDLRIYSRERLADEVPAIEISVTGGEKLVWDRPLERGDLLDELAFSQLLVENLGEAAAPVTLRWTTAPEHSQARSILGVAAAVVAIYLLYSLLYAWFPKMSAVALATAKSQMAQPLYWILMLLGIALLVLFLYIPYHTFGEDIKVLKENGITLILVFAILQAVWAASTSVEDEIEGKTAMTVLSKPIGRRQFILGKFSGIAWTSAALYVVLGVCLLVVIAYKPIYDARETSEVEPVWQECHAEVFRTVPGLVLAYMETLVFISISIAISTRLPLLANMTICFVIYAFGHLTAQLVQSGEGKLDTVKFMAQFIATVLPVLDHYTIQAAIARGIDVPVSYTFTVGVYCLLYCAMALLLALVLFEDRDLA